jgi:hypothetical protein
LATTSSVRSELLKDETRFYMYSASIEYVPTIVLKCLYINLPLSLNGRYKYDITFVSPLILCTFDEEQLSEGVGKTAGCNRFSPPVSFPGLGDSAEFSASGCGVPVTEQGRPGPFQLAASSSSSEER